MFQDLRVAWRFLLKRRVATAATVLTLGVAVGSSTVTIGALDNAFWRSIQAPGGSGLITIYNTRPAAPQFQPLSYDDYASVRDRLGERVDVAAFFRIENTLEGVQEPTRIRGELVSENYFRVLAGRAFAGRLIGSESDPAVAVLSYQTWRLRFAADPRIVGTTIQLGRDRLTVIGITEPGFHAPAYPSEFWAPLGMTKRLNGYDLAAGHNAYLQTVARPSRGVAHQQLQSYLRDFTTTASSQGWALAVLPGTYLRFWPAYRAAVARFLGIFAALAVGILIVACANVASLLLSRGAERARELAIRRALGGTRTQLGRRLIAESLLLTAAGGALGALLTWWSAPLFHDIPMPVPAPLTLTFDWRLIVIASAISLLASLLFTAAAAWKALGAHVQQVLVASSRAVTPEGLGQHALVVAQLAIGCVMVTAATLLLRSLWNVRQVDVGFDASNRVAAQISLSDRGYTAAQAPGFYQRLEDALGRRPEVESVGFEASAVLEVIRRTGRFTLPGVSEFFPARFDLVSARYFRTLDMPIVAGRAFDDHDTATSEPVMIVNKTLAEQLKGNPLGQIIRLVNPAWIRGSGARIVGVVKDAQYNGVTEGPQPFVYLPITQEPLEDLYVYVHARVPPPQAIALVRSEVHRLDPQVALTDVGALSERVDASQAVPRSAATTSIALAGIAVFLALVGVYGVMTTSIENRRRELAIRSALGASPGRLMRRIVREGATLTVLACIIGVAASLAAARAIALLLFGVPARDPWSLAAGAGVVIAASALAWIAPARRAGSVDPATVLRAE